MRKLFVLAMVLAFISLGLTSCDNSEGTLPSLAFKTGLNYTSNDTTVAIGTILKVGIIASNAENEGVLKEFNVALSKDGASSTSVITTNLSASSGGAYSTDLNFTIDSTFGGVNTYYFTVTNSDGLTNRLTLQVKTK